MLKSEIWGVARSNEYLLGTGEVPEHGNLLSL